MTAYRWDISGSDVVAVLFGTSSVGSLLITRLCAETNVDNGAGEDGIGLGLVFKITTYFDGGRHRGCE
jgi:hypothetical protein